MMRAGPWIRTLLLSVTAAMAAAPPPAVADNQMTARQFLARCDELDPGCRNEFVAGLQAVYVGRMACPPRLDVNAPITPWLDYMHRRVAEAPKIGDSDANALQLEAFMRLWPCPKK